MSKVNLAIIGGEPGRRLAGAGPAGRRSGARLVDRADRTLRPRQRLPAQLRRSLFGAVLRQPADLRATRPVAGDRRARRADPAYPCFRPRPLRRHPPDRHRGRRAGAGLRGGERLARPVPVEGARPRGGALALPGRSEDPGSPGGRLPAYPRRRDATRLRAGDPRRWRSFRAARTTWHRRGADAVPADCADRQRIALRGAPRAGLRALHPQRSDGPPAVAG